MKNILLYLTINSLFLLNNLAGQETIQVEGVTGVGIIAGGISERDARREALNDAKVEALRKAGVSEHLSSYEMLFRSETDRDYSEFFSADIHSELQGAVQQYGIVNEQRSVDVHRNVFTIEITIDATVILYSSRPDPAFNVSVEGIKGIYESGETLAFSVYSSMDCYLNIFNITDNETLLMYPNPWEEQIKISAREYVDFPFGHVDYHMEKSGREPEMNRLVFVFTKKPVQFLNYRGEYQFTTQEELFSWIYGLTPDARRVDYQVFTIR